MTKSIRLALGVVALLAAVGAVMYSLGRPAAHAEPKEPSEPSAAVGANGDRPPSFSLPGTVVDLYIADTTAPTAISPLSDAMVDAMQVAESPNGPFQADPTIKGLDYEPGFRYQVRAEKRPSDPRVMDVPSYTYLVLAVVDKQKVD